MQKPKIILSRCFCYPVRYDGKIVHDEFVERLKKFVEYEPVCPEMEIGLGVPRQRIIIIKDNETKILYQPETNRNLTNDIKRYMDYFLENIGELDGFILKSKSPSCGIASAKYYKVIGDSASETSGILKFQHLNNRIAGRTDGFFAEGIKNKFPQLPAEHEGRLKNLKLRKHFLIRIFSSAEFRSLKRAPDVKKLLEFHSRYKYLFMTYDQKNLKEMGKIVADGRRTIKEKLKIYEKLFYNTFIKMPSRSKHHNTILHIYGYFSKKLNQNEKRHFLNLLEKYKNGTVELGIILGMLKTFALRFHNTYLLSQKYLNPFPEELI